MVKAAVVVAVMVLLWVLSDWGNHRDRALRVGRALHVAKPPPPRPTGPPLEQIAADIRRIRSQISQAPPGMPVARLRGWMEAYDDLLVAACRALGVEEQLRVFPEGGQRNLERERVERMLKRAGLQLRSPA